MSKYFFVFAVCATLVLAGWGCAPKTPEQKAQDAFETMADAIASGKSVKCTIGSSDGTDSVETVYWIKGENMRGEVNINGEVQTFIEADGIMYTSADMFGESDCDWLSSPIDEEEEDGEDILGEDYEDFDYEQYEDNAMYAVDCQRESFGDEKFKVSGKVCDMEDYFAEMMGGMDFDFDM